MAGHTPGPWTRSEGWAPTLQVVDHENIYAPAPRGVVAKVVRAAQDGLYRPEYDANARLIAAAPEMSALLRDLSVARDANGEHRDGGKALWLICRETRALLAKIDAAPHA